MKDLSLQRRKVAVLAAAVACLSAATPALMRSHPKIAFFLMGIVVVGLVYVIAQFAKVSRSGN